MNKNHLLIISIFCILFFFVVSGVESLRTRRVNRGREYLKMASHAEYKDKDHKLALQYYRKGCTLNHALSCLWGGMMLKDKSLNSFLSKDLIIKACSLKNEYACELVHNNGYRRVSFKQ